MVFSHLVARIAAVLLVTLGILTGLPLRSTRAQSAPVQSLFLGDVTCADTESSCVYSDVVASHRYLHVVIHDVPRTYQWRVQAGPGCDHLQDLDGNQLVGPDGYLERVIDLESVQPPLDGTPACYIFRGLDGWPNTFYAAYFDDNPALDAGEVYPNYQDLYGRPDLPDLDVAYIHRGPAYPYDGTPNNLVPGQQVSFQGHVVNSGPLPAQPFSYTWSIDGRIVHVGRYPSVLAPGDTALLSLRQVWEPRPHAVTLTVMPSGDDLSAVNDRLTIQSNALAFGFWVERSAYTFFRDHQWDYCRAYACRGSDSLEDWLQRQLSTWNGLLAGENDPDVAPAGIADRVHLDKLTIVPDGALPLHGFAATNAPDLTDHTVDLEWGMPASGVSGYDLDGDGPFDVEWSLIHELGHARYLTDIYRLDMPVSPGEVMDVTAADGRPAFDPANPSDPSRPLRDFSVRRNEVLLYRDQEPDLMYCTCSHEYSTYTALVLDRIRGRRARCGNANPPCNIGEWFTQIPPVNLLRVLDASGKPVPNGTSIRLYFDAGQAYADHRFDDAHSQTLETAGGIVTLPADPFAWAGNAANAPRNLLLVEVRGSQDRFCFVEPTAFNVAFWSGYADAAHPAVFTLRDQDETDNGCHLGLPPALVNEPFATSPYRSTVRLGAVTAGTKPKRDLMVHLVDDVTPGDPMRNRYVEARSRTRHVLAAGTTNRDGVLHLAVPASAGSIQVVDVTDNGLVITGPGADPLHPTALPR